ncbi:MAG: hypothetical protein NTZ65_04640 [Candidatus Berkelbacteria bacterium]|nr:hypothetical protein [Candidatus Berkelbacteria bacterium]
MGLKEILKDSIGGTGEVAEALMSATTGVVKEGTHDISDIFKAIIDLGKDGAVDVAEGVKGVFIGSVNALKDSGKTTEEAVGVVATKAEQVVGEIGVGGEEAVGKAARKGIEEAKEIVKTPFKK